MFYLVVFETKDCNTFINVTKKYLLYGPYSSHWDRCCVWVGQMVQSWVRPGLAFREFIFWYGRNICPSSRNHKGHMGSDLRGARCYGIWKSMGWFLSSMVQLHEDISGTQDGTLSLSSGPLTPSLLAPQKLPTVFSDILSVPFLLSIAQRPLGSESLVCSSSWQSPGFPDLGTCTGYLLMVALMSSTYVGCTACVWTGVPDTNVLGSFLSWGWRNGPLHG